MNLMLLLALACKAPEPAPTDLDQLVGFLFEHIPDEDPAPLAEGVHNLEPWLVDRIDETLEGYTVQDLSEETILSLGDGEVDNTELSGSAVGFASVNDVQGWVDALVLADQVEIYGGSYVSYEREWEGDEEAFAGRDKLTIEADVRALSDYTLIKIESHSGNRWTWVDTEWGPAMVYRAWLEEPCTITPENIVKVDRQYYLNVIMPTRDGMRTMQATWVVGKVVGASTDTNFALQMMIQSMAKNAGKIDAWVTENQ
ncbi:MAG TPA: hypothetical protein PKY30_01820 [Myxococcota bacterium]|nr:hypothetical protein [Myxococcota bacterium]HNH45740.1 hypothetical protein [Myxococcota bacterium]